MNKYLLFLVLFILSFACSLNDNSNTQPPTSANSNDDFATLNISVNWTDLTVDISKVAVDITTLDKSKTTKFEGVYESGDNFLVNVSDKEYDIFIKYYDINQKIVAEQINTILITEKKRYTLNFILKQNEVNSTPPKPSLISLIESSAGVGINWSLDSSIESGFELSRSIDNLTFLTISSSIRSNNVTFTDKIVVPGSTYYYRIRALNRFGYSEWSDIQQIKLGGTLNYGIKVTSVKIKELDGKNNSSMPITISHIFREGEVFDAVTLLYKSQPIPTQTDIKARWPDGSIKHALISTIVPELKANSELNLDIHLSSETNTSNAIDYTEISQKGFDLIFDFSAFGVDTSLNEFINNQSSKKYWISGKIAQELLITNFNETDTTNPVNIIASVRYYKDIDAVRILYGTENVRADVRQICNYSLAIRGKLSPANKPSYDKIIFNETINHNNDSRWGKIEWIGEKPSDINIIYDSEYLISTKILPSYNTDITVSETSMNTIYSSYSTSDKGIMGNGLLNKAFGTTGWRYEIGIYPTWAAMYILSMNEKMSEITSVHGLLSGHIPIHYRETSATDYYGRIVSIDDRPTIWLGQNNWGHGFTFTYTDEKDKLPNSTGTTDETWSVDKAHQGSFAFIPYIFSGDYYFLEEVWFWAAYDIGASNPGYRDNAKGIIKDQVRGEAWAIRNVADAAFITPDSETKLKNYFTEKLNNSLDYWNDKYVVKQYHPLGCWDYISNWGCDGGRPQRYLKPNVRHMASPWQEDFVLLVMNHIVDLGFSKAEPLKQYLTNFIVGRKNLPWQRYHTYQLPMTFTAEETFDSQDNYNQPFTPYTDWNDVEAAYLKSISDLPSWYPELDSIGNPREYKTLAPEEDWPDSRVPVVFDYPFIAMAAAAGASDLAGAKDVYNLLYEKLSNARDNLKDNPTFALKPRN